MRNKPYFITIEGIEGVGKSSVTDIIRASLTEKKIAFVATREPGGTPIAEAIRQLILQTHSEAMQPDTELLLLFAGRAQHIAQVIKPALSANQWVICDRFTDASYAYQGAGRGMEVSRIAVLENWVQGTLQPDLTLLLDAPVEIALRRIQKRAKDRIEQEAYEFFERIRAAYLERAQQYPNRYRLIDASYSLECARIQIEAILETIIQD